MISTGRVFVTIKLDKILCSRFTGICRVWKVGARRRYFTIFTYPYLDTNCKLTEFKLEPRSNTCRKIVAGK